MKEEFLEPLLRRMRMSKILPVIKKFPTCTLLDIGCGWEAKFLLDAEPYIFQGVGVDFKAPEINTGKVTTLRLHLSERLPFSDSSFDVVTMLAVLEHLDSPENIVQEIRRVLRPGGIFAGTVPSKISKPVLEFLAFRLGIVNPSEIRDHKCYYDKASLVRLFSSAGFSNVEHSVFQLGMNNFFMASVAKC